MRDLKWMRNLPGPPVAGLSLMIVSGRRVAVAATRHVFVGVRLGDDEGAALPVLQDVRSEKTGRMLSEHLRDWLTGRYVTAEIPTAQLREWATGDGPQFGAIGSGRFDRKLVAAAIAHAPDAEAVKVGFDDAHGSLVLSFEGYRAVVAPANPTKATEGGPLLALPEGVGA